MDVDLVRVSIAQDLDLSNDHQPNGNEIFQVKNLADLELLKLTLEAVVALFRPNAAEGRASHFVLVDGRLGYSDASLSPEALLVAVHRKDALWQLMHVLKVEL